MSRLFRLRDPSGLSNHRPLHALLINLPNSLLFDPPNNFVWTVIFRAENSKPRARVATTTPASDTPTPDCFQDFLDRNPQIQFHAFLSHDWGTDELGRQNHDRVMDIGERLKQAGVRAWIDSDQRRGDDTNQAMIDGINQSACVIVFVTRNYQAKVRSSFVARLPRNP